MDRYLDTKFYYAFILAHDKTIDLPAENDLAFIKALKISSRFLVSPEWKDTSVSGYDAFYNYLKNNGYIKEE